MFVEQPDTAEKTLGGKSPPGLTCGCHLPGGFIRLLFPAGGDNQHCRCHDHESFHISGTRPASSGGYDNPRS
jgi:hypothetical protein